MRNHGAAAVGTLRGTRRDYPSIGCLECITIRPLEWAGQVAGAERLRDVAGTRLLKQQTPHPLALPHIKTET